MKNVLFATTALVAMAGMANAAAHSGVSWAADVTTGYYDTDSALAAGDAGFYVEGGLDLTAFVALENDVTVEVTYGIDIYNAGGWGRDDFPTLVITTNLLTFTAGTVEFAAADNYSGVDGMAGTTGFVEENGEFVVRLDASFGDIAVALSGATNANDQLGSPIGQLSLGASGSFGSVDFGIGYEDGGEMGANVGVALGSFNVDLAYQTDGTNNAVGVGVGANVGSFDVAAYYALNSAAADAYGVSVDGSFGNVNVGVYYDDNGTSNFGIDLDMAVSDAITAYAGYDQANSFYLGAVMAVAEGAEVGVSYADDTGVAAARDVDHGPKDFQDGISVWFSASF